jgi:hypothetical protein
MSIYPTIRPHNGVNFAFVDAQIQAFQNFLAVDSGVQIFNF